MWELRGDFISLFTSLFILGGVWEYFVLFSFLFLSFLFSFTLEEEGNYEIWCKRRELLIRNPYVY